MKMIRFRSERLKIAALVGLVTAALVFFTAPVQSQSYSIDWYTTDGGGGTSAGGVYSVSGTIGQPDTGSLSGGNYALEGGFWSVFAVQVPGAPTLLIAASGLGMATISWDAGTPGFVLQMNNAIDNPAGWSDAPSGSANPTSVTTSGDKRFYRLRKP
jgi:hypothetical protein